MKLTFNVTLADFSSAFFLPLRNLSYWNPFKNVVWHGELDTPLRLEEVNECLHNPHLIKDHSAPIEETRTVKCSRADHAPRVAKLGGVIQSVLTLVFHP